MDSSERIYFERIYFERIYFLPGLTGCPTPSSETLLIVHCRGLALLVNKGLHDAKKTLVVMETLGPATVETCKIYLKIMIIQVMIHTLTAPQT